MADDSAVGDDVHSSAQKKRFSRSKELLDPGTKPGERKRSLRFNVAAKSLIWKYRFDEQAERVGGQEKGCFSFTRYKSPTKDFQS